MKNLEVLLQICDLQAFTEFHYSGENMTNASIVRTLYDMSIKIEDSMLDCKWRSKKTSCESLFRPILTEEGFCFTFNSLNSRDIYTEEYDTYLIRYFV